MMTEILWTHFSHWHQNIPASYSSWSMTSIRLNNWIDNVKWASTELPMTILNATPFVRNYCTNSIHCVWAPRCTDLIPRLWVKEVKSGTYKYIIASCMILTNTVSYTVIQVINLIAEDHEGNANLTTDQPAKYNCCPVRQQYGSIYLIHATEQASDAVWLLGTNGSVSRCQNSYCSSSKWLERPAGRPHTSCLATTKHLSFHNLHVENATKLALDTLLWRLLAASRDT